MNFNLVLITTINLVQLSNYSVVILTELFYSVAIAHNYTHHRRQQRYS